MVLLSTLQHFLPGLFDVELSKGNPFGKATVILETVYFVSVAFVFVKYKQKKINFCEDN